jgi:putative ABC transport system substrate-binding protein
LIVEALRGAGYELGKNLSIEVRYGEGDVARLAGLADELVKLNVELILAVTNEPIEAARRATRNIPIVMIGAALPVELGFIESLARPGANVTGTAWASLEMSGKVLQVLKEAAPHAVRVAILASPTTPGTQKYRAENQRAAKALGLKVRAFDMTPDEGVATTLKRVAASRPDALYIAGEGVVGTLLTEIAAFAVRHKLLAIGVTPQFIPAGGALYYGPSLTSLVERTVSYIDRILKGAKPADLPVEQPTKYDLIINLKTLRSIGITIPQSLLLRADEVIQ